MWRRLGNSRLRLLLPILYLRAIDHQQKGQRKPKDNRRPKHALVQQEEKYNKGPAKRTKRRPLSEAQCDLLLRPLAREYSTPTLVHSINNNSNSNSNSNSNHHNNHNRNNNNNNNNN